MRIFLHSRAFVPNLGGVEQMSYMLARGLTAKGHSVFVATDVPADPDFDRKLPFEVMRGGSAIELVRAARNSDLVHASGASLAATGLALLARRPLVVTHHGYQATCLEGLGKHGGTGRAARQLATRLAAPRSTWPVRTWR